MLRKPPPAKKRRGTTRYRKGSAPRIARLKRKSVLKAPVRTSRRVNYVRYINSKAWKTKRKWFIAQQVQECFCCSKPYQSGFHVHHVSYKNLGAEKLADLRLVCVSCHDEIHVYEKSHDVSLLEATNHVKSLKGKTNRLEKKSSK